LLHTLNLSVDALLIDPSAPRAWMVPVNMRGADDRLDETANHVASLTVGIPPGSSAADVHRTIRELLRRDVHWTRWWRLRLLGPILVPLMRRALAKGKRPRKYTLGAFSNLGEWSSLAREGEDANAETWGFAPPVTRHMAIGAGALIWRGQLTLALHVHPAVADHATKARHVLELWRQILDEKISDARTSPTRPDGRSTPCVSPTTS
jgi:hypothetical protein